MTIDGSSRLFVYPVVPASFAAAFSPPDVSASEGEVMNCVFPLKGGCGGGEAPLIVN